MKQQDEIPANISSYTCNVFTFICRRQVGAAIRETESDADLMLTLQSKSTRRGNDTNNTNKYEDGDGNSGNTK